MEVTMLNFCAIHVQWESWMPFYAEREVVGVYFETPLPWCTSEV